MGLMVHSLNEIPRDVKRGYYIYLLDYGWKEPLSNAIRENYDKIAELSSKNNAVFITGIDGGSYVDNEILSWHHINGEHGADILPALLITTENPHVFREIEHGKVEDVNSKIILIPLKKCCATTIEVIELIAKIFRDIENGTEIENFQIQKKMTKNGWKKFLDGVILQPNISGIGFDLKRFFDQ